MLHSRPPSFIHSPHPHAFPQVQDGPVRLYQPYADASSARKSTHRARFGAASYLEAGAGSPNGPPDEEEGHKEEDKESSRGEQCSFRWFSPEEACDLLSTPPTILIFVGDR